MKTWKAENMLFETTRAASVGPRIFSYVTEICQDLGISPRRKSWWNPFVDFFLPYTADDFKGLLDEVKHASIKSKRN